MPTTTHSIPIDGTQYVNVSEGNLNCTLFLTTGQRVRCTVTGVQPTPDDPVYFLAEGPEQREPGLFRTAFIGFEGLPAEAELWVRLDDDEEAARDFIVMRGDTVVRLGA